MDTFYMVVNGQKDPDLETAEQIRSYLEQRGKKCGIWPGSCARPGDCRRTAAVQIPSEEEYRAMDGTQLPKDADCVLVLGGDGTLLQAARELVDREVPLIGINLGTLGYLAEVDRRNIFPAMDRLMEGNCQIEGRMMLHGAAYHQNRRLLDDIALNDIVISRNGRLRVVDFHVYVDGEFLSSYTADGVIISTPTGSTGYNLSVGGPIVAPQASLILLTAIAPHTLNSRPIVLPDSVEIAIEIGAGRQTDIDGAEATFDGDTSVKLNAGDRIVVTKSERRTLLVKTKNASFLEVLREKMNR